MSAENDGRRTSEVGRPTSAPPSPEPPPSPEAPQPTGRLLARNTLLNLLGLGLPLVVGVFTMPPVIDGLGPERFGVLALVWVALGYLNLLDLGLGRAVTRFAAEALARSDEPRLVASVRAAAGIQAALGIVGGVAMAALAPWLTGRVLNIPPGLVGPATTSFQLIALATPALALTTTFRGLLEAGQRFDLVNAVRLPVSTTNFLLPLVGVLLGWSLVGIVASMVVVRFLTLMVFVGLGLRLHPGLLRRHRAGPAPSVLREVLGFGGWITVSSLINPVLIYADRFVIGGLLTVAAVTFYTAPHEVVTRLTILPTSLVGTLFPAFSSLVGQRKEELEKLVGRAVKVLLVGVGLALVALTTLADDLLRLWLGADFAATSAPVLRLLAIGLLANALAYVPSALIQARGRPDVTAKLHLLELPIHLILLWLLVRGWGIAGAAGAWSVRMLLDAGLLFFAAHRLGMVSVPGALRRVPEGLALLVAVAGGGTALVGAAPELWQRVALGASALLVVGVWSWLRLFTVEERRWLAGAFHP